jgi:hypothetical protein
MRKFLSENFANTSRLTFKWFLMVLFLGIPLFPFSLQAQEIKEEKPIKVMLVGTVHLDNPGRDAYNPEVPDVLQPQKQEELRELRNALAKFNPDKVALEVRMKHQAAFDSLYQSFRKGELDTSFAVGDFVSVRSEQYQVGFRLAKQLGHEHVWAIDHFIPMQFGRVMSFAKEHDAEFMNYAQKIISGEMAGQTDSLLQHSDLISVYRHLNSPSTIRRYREPYVRTLSVGNDTTYVGADVVAAYHKRNLRIYANLMKIAEPGDRIFMMFGAGHQTYLRPLLKASPRIEFVDPLDYLQK